MKSPTVMSSVPRVVLQTVTVEVPGFSPEQIVEIANSMKNGGYSETPQFQLPQQDNRAITAIAHRPKPTTSNVDGGTDDLYSVAAAARRLGVNPSFLAYQVKAGKINRIDSDNKHERKITRSELDRFARENASLIADNRGKPAGSKKPAATRKKRKYGKQS